MAIVLSDFDASGLSVEFLALLERPSTTDTRVLYADTSHGPDPGQSPVEGELGIGPDDTVISRLLNQANVNLTLNDRDLPAALALGGYLGPTGAGNSMTLWFQREGVARAGMLLSAVTVSGGGNYANIACPDPVKAILNNLGVGEQYLFGGTRPAGVAALAAEGSLTGALSLGTTGAAALVTLAALGAVGTLSGGLAIATTGAAALGAAPALEAVGSLTGGLSLTTTGVASLPDTVALRATGAADGGIAIVTTAAAALVSPDPLGAAGALSGGLSAILSGDAAIRAGPAPLLLADAMLPDGHEAEALALIVASGDAILYADASRSGTGVPLDGELGIGPDDTLLSRVWVLTQDDGSLMLRINDDDNPDALALGDYLSSGGAGNGLYVFFQTADGVASFAVADALLTQVGPSWANFAVPDADETLIGGISTGDRFLFGFTRPAPLEAVGGLSGAVALATTGVASLSDLAALRATGAADGEIAIVTTAAAALASPAPLEAAGALSGGLSAVLSGSAAIGAAPVPTQAVGALTGGLTTALAGDAALAYAVTPVIPGSQLQRQLARVQGQVQKGLGNLTPVTLHIVSRARTNIEGDPLVVQTRATEARVGGFGGISVAGDKTVPASGITLTIYDPDVRVTEDDFFTWGTDGVRHQVRRVSGLVQDVNNSRYVTRARVD